MRRSNFALVTVLLAAPLVGGCLKKKEEAPAAEAKAEEPAKPTPPPNPGDAEKAKAATAVHPAAAPPSTAPGGKAPSADADPNAAMSLMPKDGRKPSPERLKAAEKSAAFGKLLGAQIETSRASVAACGQMVPKPTMVEVHYRIGADGKSTITQTKCPDAASKPGCQCLEKVVGNFTFTAEHAGDRFIPFQLSGKAP